MPGLPSSNSPNAPARLGSRLSAYEAGAVAPAASTLDRLFAAASCHLTIEDCSPLTASEERSLHLHTTIVERLLSNQAAVLAKAKHNLAVMRAADELGHTVAWLDQWEELLAGDLATLVATMFSTTENARALRQSTPFAGVLSTSERKAAIRRTARRDGSNEATRPS